GIVGAGREAPEIAPAMGIARVVDANRRAEADDDRDFVGRQLAAAERRRHVLEPADVQADVRPHRRRRLTDGHLPAAQRGFMADDVGRGPLDSVRVPQSRPPIKTGTSVATPTGYSPD